MNEASTQQEAVELLQDLGLKQYEADCFVSLSRLPRGTAKQISEISEVPRTRIYDAIRVLEAKGLVEVQRSNPQQFRAVPVTEATETLRKEYETRAQRLAETLVELDSADSGTGDDGELANDVWALSGDTSIENRTLELIDDADEEVVLVVGREEVCTPELFERLRTARRREIPVFVGTVTEELRDRVVAEMPDVEVFVSGLDWLRSSPIDVEDTTAISRLVLVDREAILVSSMTETSAGDGGTEKAVFGSGFENGIVVIARRLMATGLGSADGLERFPG